MLFQVLVGKTAQADLDPSYFTPHSPLEATIKDIKET